MSCGCNVSLNNTKFRFKWLCGFTAIDAILFLGICSTYSVSLMQTLSPNYIVVIGLAWGPGVEILAEYSYICTEQAWSIRVTWKNLDRSSNQSISSRPREEQTFILQRLSNQHFYRYMNQDLEVWRHLKRSRKCIKSQYSGGHCTSRLLLRIVSIPDR